MSVEFMNPPIAMNRRKRKLFEHNDRYKFNRDLSSSSFRETVLSDSETESPSTNDYARMLRRRLGLKKQRLLSFNNRPVPSKLDSRHIRLMREEETIEKVPKATFRHVPNTPVRILDAPDIVNDFYMTHTDWSLDNMLAVALDNTVYLWNANENSILELTSYADSNKVTCVSFSQNSPDYLMTCADDGDSKLYSVSTQKAIRRLSGNQGRINVCDWNESIIATGSEDNSIVLHDVRVRNSVVNELDHHKGSICSLKWDYSGFNLASGGNDDDVFIYDHRASSVRHVLTDHKAAVKGLSWSITKPGILATGGGIQDKTIKLWNATQGRLLESTKVTSAVTGLQFSSFGDELVASVGKTVQLMTSNQHKLQLAKTLNTHSEKILGQSISPCGTMILTAGADETLCFWEVFQKKVQNSRKGTSKMVSDNILR